MPLAKASQVGIRFWQSCVTDMNVTAVQSMVLNFLGEKDAVTSKELGERTYLDSATLTGLLDRLEAAGYIERQRHPEDRRAILICLTDTGRKLTEALHQKMLEANQAFLAHLNREEQRLLRRLLGKIRKPA